MTFDIAPEDEPDHLPEGFRVDPEAAARALDGLDLRLDQPKTGVTARWLDEGQRLLVSELDQPGIGPLLEQLSLETGVTVDRSAIREGGLRHGYAEFRETPNGVVEVRYRREVLSGDPIDASYDYSPDADFERKMRSWLDTNADAVRRALGL
jgi:hypothetical protein